MRERLSASTLFQAGAEQEQQADSAWEQDDLTVAGRLYTAAQEQFQQARHDADTEQERHKTVAVQDQMRAERERVAGLQEWAESSWAAAQAQEQRAEHACQQAANAEDYQHAQTYFQQAQGLYTQVGEEGENGRLRAEVDHAANTVNTAQGLAEQEQAEDYAATLFNDGRKAQAAAQQASQPG